MAQQRIKMTGEQRKEQIKAIALQLFAKHKFEGTTMASIAEAAGISEPLVYQHFKNKKEIFLTLLSDIHAEWFSDSELILNGGGNISDRFARLFDLHLNNLTVLHRQRAKMFILASAVPDDDILAEVRRFNTHMNQLYTETIEEFARGKKITLKYSPDAMAWIFFGLIFERAALVMHGMDNSINKVFKEAVALTFSQIE